MDDLTTTRTGLRLPAIDPHDREQVFAHLASIADGMPELSLQLSNSEAYRGADESGENGGPFTHWEVLHLIVSLVETLFDEEVVAFSPAFHAQLAIMLQFPVVPDAVSMQIAFGREMGEESLRVIERLVAAAESLGLPVDEHIADLAASGQIGHDLPARCFRGELHRSPDRMRMRKAIDFFRVTAAQAPEPLRPPVLCVIAWLLWAMGKRPVALVYLREAVAIDPGHILALGCASHFSGHQPEWVRG